MTRKEEINLLKMLSAYEVVRKNPTILNAVMERINELRQELKRYK